MSYPALSWALRQRLEPVPRLVLLALADRADKQGRAWPSVAYLAEFCGFHRSTVMKELKRLKRARLIEETGDRKGITHQVRVYRLRMDEETLPLELPSETTRGNGRSGATLSKRGNCRSVGDCLDGLKGSLNGATLSEIGKGRSGATGSRRRPVAPNAGKGRSGATWNQLETVIIPFNGATPCETVFDGWNRMASANGLSIARSLTPDRRKQLSDRIAEHGAETILAAIATVPASSFLCGDNARGWRADFDFFVSPRGMNKIVDGAFVDAKGKE